MTSQEKILEKIFVYLNRLAPPDTAIHPDVDLIQELGLDSIKVMDLLMEMEDEFDISIPLNVLTDVRTPAQLAHAVIALLEPEDGTVR